MQDATSTSDATSVPMPWPSPEADAVIRERWLAGVNDIRISLDLGVSADQVTKRRRKIGVTETAYPNRVAQEVRAFWTPMHDDVLRRRWDAGWSAKRIAAEFCISQTSVLRRRNQLKLPKERVVTNAAKASLWWSDERIELVKRRWSEGANPTQIAAELGDGVTPAKVSGKIDRLGLRVHGAPRRQSPPAPRQGNPADAGLATQIAKISRGERAPRAAFPVLVTGEAVGSRLNPDDVPIGQRKTPFDLTNDTCRWPYGDPGTPGFFYCGAMDANNAGHRPYCVFHTRIAYGRVPPTTQERERRHALGKTIAARNNRRTA